MVTNDNEEELPKKKDNDSVLRLVQVIGETRQFCDMLRSRAEIMVLAYSIDLLRGHDVGLLFARRFLRDGCRIL